MMMEEKKTPERSYPGPYPEGPPRPMEKEKTPGLKAEGKPR